MLTIIVNITGRSMLSVSIYCENKGGGLYVVIAVIVTIMTIKGGLYVVLTIMVTITGRYMCSVSSYCDTNGEIYMYC